ncbi:ATP-binding cassette sub-family C member 2-like [Oppia nitens]|uniref:ATP-binding cassette sub-family C member 2-like n=1 Tax=Oppia nitens TaxID=1686743 RepID=UPI0023DBC00A|nr:ATP-binding cassette sub-family C member 2-like [Oppia nitens]
MDSLVDTNQRCMYSTASLNSWLQIRLDGLASLLILFAGFLLTVQRREASGGGDTGMSLCNVTNLSYLVGLLVRLYGQFVNSMVSYERLAEYCHLKPETGGAAHRQQTTTGQQLLPTAAADDDDNQNWPNSGRIEFHGYSARYRQGLELVLNEIDLHINSGEKIGIVGRTGSGKSSLVLALFRLIEPAVGRIVIDGIDIGRLDLPELRSRLTILPQEPIVYTGTVRSNLDPFARHTDPELWSVLERSHLKSYVQSLDGQLDSPISESGDNLSVGQRQLICLARALLRNTRVLILDEATASVDVQTDALIQQTIRQEFRESTVLTIAHRIHTIMDSDRVIVLNNGRVVEFAEPDSLLSDSSTIFYSLAKNAGVF